MNDILIMKENVIVPSATALAVFLSLWKALSQIRKRHLVQSVDDKICHSFSALVSG